MIQRAIIKYLKKYQQESLVPKAVLFDMDGVLYDSMRFHSRAWHEVSLNRHLICQLEDFYMYEGRTGASTIDELFRRTFHRNATEEEKESIYKEKAELFTKYNDGLPMPGAADVLKKVQETGLERLIVTGSGQLSLIDKLNHSYPGHFDRNKMVTAFDVKIGKPDPEPYLMGLKKACVKANEAFVIENAPMGIQAATAAKIFTIAVNTGPLSDKVLLDSGADLLYKDMTSLAKDWNQIIEFAKMIKME